MPSLSQHGKETLDRIVEELEDHEISNYEQKPFVTLDSLKNILPESRVALIIGAMADSREIEVWQQSELIRMVADNGLRVFATLLLMSRPGLIQDFKETDHFAHSQLDSRLPLSIDSLNQIFRDVKISTRFYKKQWRFLAPFFRADQSHRELQETVILPFTKCEPLGEGGFGNIDKMTMAASYQGLVSERTGEVIIIRKQIKPRTNAQDDFRQEEHILSFLRCLKHPNIIALFTTYTIHQTHYLLFPQADGNLKQLLRENLRPRGFETENEVFQALYELTSAIEAVHDYFSETFNVRMIGCHYDLKPDNILYRGGTLILSDFGLSRLSKLEEGSKALYKNGGAEYWAPECHSVSEDFRRRYVGRSSDMWSFGCILSEVLTFLQEGPIGVETFSENRVLSLEGYLECRLFHAGAKPSVAVTQWLSRMGSYPKITESQESLMAVIKGLLQHEPEARSTAHVTTLSLFTIAQSEVYRNIEERFQRLLIEPDFETYIEYQRFRIWGETTGFGTQRQVPQTGNQQNLNIFADLQRIRECLFKLRQEVNQISAASRISGPKPYRNCYHLQKVLGDLWNLQPAAIRGSMMSLLENRILATDDRNQLTPIVAALQRADPTSSDNGSMAYGHIGLLAAMKQVASALENKVESSESMLIDMNRITRPLEEFHWYGIGILQGADGSEKQILVESLTYEGFWANRIDELIQRVQDIASFRSLPSPSRIFPVLTSAGYYHNVAEHSFGIVYYFPSQQPSPSFSLPKIERPRSLRAIISKLKSRTARPSLEQIYSLASNLVNVVLTMHKAGWLHKSISSYNIIFWPDRFSSVAEAMNEPYFIGFSYSRLNLETAFTQGPSQYNKQRDYQHPEYSEESKRFRQEYDYYSVGLVLLELGLWCPLEAMTKSISGSPTEMLRNLLEREVPQLKTYVGIAYEDAVVTCLKSDFGVGLNPAEVREAFEQRVLRKIEQPFQKCSQCQNTTVSAFNVLHAVNATT